VSDSRASQLLYVGLMSGTSMDGIDAALVEFGDHQCDVLATLESPYPDELRDQLIVATQCPAECTLDTIGKLDQWVGECFRDAAIALLDQHGVAAASINAIGSHGQTLRHQPRAARPFTLQIGDANIIAAGTGITTVADFRRRDLALGGEGAPLAPAFHQWLFADTGKNRAVLNIGGMANVTLLRPGSPTVLGFDTGPGNTLLDAWCRESRNKPYDEGGAWAASGKVLQPLLDEMLADSYFELPPPKSTGFEYFNNTWIKDRIAAVGKDVAVPQDLQATLAELSAQTIAMSVLEHAPAVEQVLVCGGGVHNDDLMQRLQSHLPGASIQSTEAFGLHPDWVEAAAFAWLAKRRLDEKPGNLPAVTGATQAAVLGSIFSR
jgi:anhydro-N-acetylmuramic acid kinase